MKIKQEPLEVDGIKCYAESFNPKNGKNNYYAYLENNARRAFAYRYKTKTGWKAETSVGPENREQIHFPEDTSHNDVVKWALDVIKEHYPERYENILNPEYKISFTKSQWKTLAFGLDIGWGEGAMGSDTIKPILMKIKEACPGVVQDALLKELAGYEKTNTN